MLNNFGKAKRSKVKGERWGKTKGEKNQVESWIKRRLVLISRYP